LRRFFGREGGRGREREGEKAALNFGQMDVTKRQYGIEEQVYI
jgi:hypothetical protein